MSIITENTFESAIVQSLIENGGDNRAQKVAGLSFLKRTETLFKANRGNSRRSIYIFILLVSNLRIINFVAIINKK